LHSAENCGIVTGIDKRLRSRAVTDTAFNLAQVFWDERAALRGEPLPSAAAPNTPDSRIAAINKDFSQLDAADLAGTYRQLNGDNRWALAVSGGGIRSAAFGLGIIQCFADHRVASKLDQNQTEPLLQQFDYLSTVSGGGYVGSWLSGWLYHARRLAGAGQAAAVIAQLNGRVGDHHEVEPINNLRRNTHYLAPSFSALSPDVWTDIAAIARNLLLNWLLFFPPMILTVLATKALAFRFADDATKLMGSALIVALTVGSILCVLFALTFAAANRPSRNLVNLPQGFFLVFDLLVFVVGALLLAFVLVAHGGQEAISWAAGWLASWLDHHAGLNIGYVRYIVGAGFGFGLYLVSWLAAYLWKLVPGDAEPYRPEYRLRFTFIDLFGWCVAGIAFGTLVAAGLQLLEWAVKTQVEIALIGAVVLAVPHGLLPTSSSWCWSAYCRGRTPFLNTSRAPAVCTRSRCSAGFCGSASFFSAPAGPSDILGDSLHGAGGRRRHFRRYFSAARQQLKDNLACAGSQNGAPLS
jgi:hypothetical protein